MTAVQRLKQNVYFELEGPIVETPEPVKLDPIILKSKLKETLTQKNVQLTEPPYYYPVGTNSKHHNVFRFCHKDVCINC